MGGFSPGDHCGRSDRPGGRDRLVEFGGCQIGAAELGAGHSADEKHLSVAENSGRVAVPRGRHTAGANKGGRGRAAQFGGEDAVTGVIQAPCDQDSAAAQHGCTMVASRGGHGTDCGKRLGSRVVEIRGSAGVATGNQYLSVIQPDGRGGGVSGGHEADGRERSERRMYTSALLSEPPLFSPPATSTVPSLSRVAE